MYNFIFQRYRKQNKNYDIVLKIKVGKDVILYRTTIWSSNRQTVSKLAKIQLQKLIKVSIVKIKAKKFY